MTQTTGTFTRMDESTAEQWGVIMQETIVHQERVVPFTSISDCGRPEVRS